MTQDHNGTALLPVPTASSSDYTRTAVTALREERSAITLELRAVADACDRVQAEEDRLEVMRERLGRRLEQIDVAMDLIRAAGDIRYLPKRLRRNGKLTLSQRILILLQDGRPRTPKEIADAVSGDLHSTRVTLSRMRDEVLNVGSVGGAAIYTVPTPLPAQAVVQ